MAWASSRMHSDWASSFSASSACGLSSKHLRFRRLACPRLLSRAVALWGGGGEHGSPELFGAEFHYRYPSRTS